MIHVFGPYGLRSVLQVLIMIGYVDCVVEKLYGMVYGQKLFYVQNELGLWFSHFFEKNIYPL